MWSTFFILSVACPTVAALLLFGVGRAGLCKKKRISIFNLLFASVFAAAFFMFMPTHLSTAELTAIGCVRATLLSVFNAIQVFAAGCEFGSVMDNMTQCPQWLNILYQTWIAIVYVAAPMFTVGIVLSMFKNMSAGLKYRRAYFKDVYVFSELNEKSLALASDIRQKHSRAAIVFTDVFEGDGETGYELNEQAKRLGAICFKKDVLVVNFKKHSKSRPICFFAIGADETENLNQALKLIEMYKDRDNTHLYVFSIKLESEVLLTAVDKGKVRVRRISEVRSLINRILYERGDVIFDSAVQDASGERCISAVVIGMGNHGTEMVKALSWYGQMDGYRLEICAFDKDPLAEERFAALVPELMSAEYNGVEVTGEARYHIAIRSGIDVNTLSFAKEIGKLGNATYVFVALGDDDININTAVNLRMYFERLHIHPVIQAVVYNPQQKKALEGVRNYRGQAYDIEFIGDIASSYTEDVIIDSELEEEALQRHLKWGNEEEFWTYEYNYRSSVASAIHRKARIACGISGASKREEELTDEERAVIEVLEHRRWNAYMRSEGYVFSGSTDKESRNDLAKMHHNLVDYSSLTEADKRKDSRVGTN